MIEKIDVYTDKIYVRFNGKTQGFVPITSFPHYNYWRKVLRYLKARGFKIKTPKYFEDSKYGKAEHKVAYRGNVVVTLECMNSQIAIEFGDVKNLWPDWEFNFWSLTDSRSKPLTYLESKKVELEVSKLLKTFPQEFIVYNDERLTPTEEIIKSKKESCHSRDKGKLDELGLEGVSYQMSDYDHTQNSNDKNKKRIICGDLKYYYTYKRKLVCGKVYHHLNNRWMVLLPDGLDYVSSWELFDFSGEDKKKKLTKEEQINRLNRELKRYEEKRNYTRCIKINNQIEKLKGTENTYHVWSLKHDCWWGANSNGYTKDKSYAGIYLESEILRNKDYFNDGKQTRAILI